MDTMRTVLALFHESLFFVCELYPFTLQLSVDASYYDSLNTTCNAYTKTHFVPV